MKVIIETIPHQDQRYPTVGDWQFLQGTAAQNRYITHNALYSALTEGKEVLYIRVSSMSDWRHEALVAVHELVEALACKHGEVSEKAVDDFDMNYKGRYDEPGDDPLAPYWSEHGFATRIETQLMGELEVDPDDYEKEVDELNASTELSRPTDTCQACGAEYDLEDGHPECPEEGL